LSFLFGTYSDIEKPLNCSLNGRKKRWYMPEQPLQLAFIENIFKIPLVLQYNKRDLEEEGISVMGLDQMERELNSKLKAPSFPASALKGVGVSQSLKKCLALTLAHLKKEFQWSD
jgi:hypothetical protein